MSDKKVELGLQINTAEFRGARTYVREMVDEFKRLNMEVAKFSSAGRGTGSGAGGGSAFSAGTSSAGAELNATHNRPDLANYFVGNKYLRTDLAAPQRIVWVPPSVGQERLGPPDKQGWTTDEVPAGGPQRAYRAIYTRLSPWTVEMWARDHEDAIELGNWLIASYHMVNAGRTIIGGQSLPADSLGWVPDESLQDGVKWQCTLWFAWPVVVPYLTQREMEAAMTRTLPAFTNVSKAQSWSASGVALSSWWA